MFQSVQMTGPQLNLWRTAENLSLRDASDLLAKAGYKVTHVTLSRWERLPDPIPQWATDALLAKTRLELPLDLLYIMLDYAKQHSLSFGDVLSKALTEFLASQPPTQLPSPPKVLDYAEDAKDLPQRVAEDPPRNITHPPEPPDGVSAALAQMEALDAAAKQPKAANSKGSA